MLRSVLFFLLFIISLLEARENPFFPVDKSQDLPLTSNQIKKAPLLKRATITLPSTAREVESVTIKYKNLDGSITQKTVLLQNSIDWHLPLFLSQNYNLNGSPVCVKKSKKQVYKKIFSLKFIHFYEQKNRLKILTTDKLLRNFLLVKPHRIVCDFKRDTNIRSFIKKGLKGSVFKKIRVGTHAGYYRVVIELDGFYRYKVHKIASGYLFTLS